MDREAIISLFEVTITKWFNKLGLKWEKGVHRQIAEDLFQQLQDNLVTEYSEKNDSSE